MPLSLGLVLGAIGLALVWRVRWLRALVMGCGLGVVLVSSSVLVLAPYCGSEAAAMADLLADLGVPREAILLEAQGRNTQGHADFSKVLLQPLGIHRVLLVTSA